MVGSQEDRKLESEQKKIKKIYKYSYKGVEYLSLNSLSYCKELLYLYLSPIKSPIKPIISTHIKTTNNNTTTKSLHDIKKLLFSF